MEQKKGRLYATFFCFAGLLCLLSVQTAAYTENSFHVQAVLPANQIDTDAAYFDLQMEPAQEQELTVRIDNPSSREITVVVETVTASTNRNGIIHYASPLGLMDDNIPFLFSEIAEVEAAELTIPANSGKLAKIRVAMPEAPYEGTLLGAIRVTKGIDEGDLDSETGIINQYSYTVGVRLTEGNSSTDPEFALRSVGMELANHKAAIVAEINNPQPVLIKDLQAEVVVYPFGFDTPMIQLRQDGVEMAPHSIFPMTLTDAAGYGFPAGIYTAIVTLEHKGRTWQFEEQFEILPDQAEYVNGNAVNQTAPVSDNNNYMLLIAALAALFILVIIVLLLRAKRRR